MNPCTCSGTPKDGYVKKFKALETTAAGSGTERRNTSERTATMKFVRRRKPRGIKKNGRRSLDMCPDCFSFHCDPMTMSREFRAKIQRRLSLGLCGACGHNPCTCRSTLITTKVGKIVGS